MNDKFKEFKIKVEQSENAALIDSLIEHAKNLMKILISMKL